jgi:hypothetical protein
MAGDLHLRLARLCWGVVRWLSLLMALAMVGIGIWVVVRGGVFGR